MTNRTGEGRHVPRRGWLQNGNPPGDLQAAARCGTKTRSGTSCQAPSMRNGRCRLHGGKSTGPRTAEGLERCRRTKWKHGWYSKEALADRRGLRKLLRGNSGVIAEFKRIIAGSSIR